MEWLERAINRQRDYIEELLAEPLREISGICAGHWHDREVLDRELLRFLENKSGHRCRQLYAIDALGIQYSSTITDASADDSIIGQDLSARPYLDHVGKEQQREFVLSDVYIDRKSHKPCITALHSVRVDDQVAGYIAADFGLKDLPLKNVDDNHLLGWRQIKGDPSIRSTLFQQSRTRSAMDEHLGEVLDVIESLMTEQGIFHAKLHFSSSRATLWPYSDPYRYRLHVLDEIISPRVCLVYAKTSYPELTAIPAETVPRILKVFKSLREADETIYLRAGSLNIMNGLVGLNFSCDGSHYINFDEFLYRIDEITC